MTYMWLFEIREGDNRLWEEYCEGCERKTLQID